MNAIEMHARPALAPRVRLQKDALTGMPVLLYPEGFVELNETAHEIVSRCDGSRTLEQLIAALADEFSAKGDELKADVIDCVDELYRRNLITL